MSRVTHIPSVGQRADNRYLLTQEIGQGSVGVVFEARDSHENPHDDVLALKILRPKIISEQGGIERFQREAHLAQLLSHPNSIRVYDYGVHCDPQRTQGLPYIVMERLVGVDLQRYLEERETLPVAHAMGILQEALKSLQEAHKQGIIHRDLKPGNIFLHKEPSTIQVKVLDYGMAKAISDAVQLQSSQQRITALGMICGTPQCMAPEQARGEPLLTPAVDVYALGCLAFQMLTGRPLYTGTGKIDVARKHVVEPTPPLPNVYASTHIGAFIRRALAKDPTQRFADASEMFNALQTALARDGIRSSLPTHLASPSSPATFPSDDLDEPTPILLHPLTIGVLTLSLLAGAGALFWFVLF